jgi:hypothetical protein
LYRYGDEWHFHNPGNDTIYAISGLNYETIAVVKMGEGGVQLNEVIDPSEVIGQYNIEILAENQRYWMIKKTLITVADVKDYGAGQWGGMWDWDHSFVIVDKETGIAQNYKFEDDLFGIIPWGEMNYHFWWDDSGRFYMVIGAMNLVESIDQALEDGTIPDKNLDRVKELRQSITEESNPVLFLFEEREKYKI